MFLRGIFPPEQSVKVPEREAEKERERERERREKRGERESRVSGYKDGERAMVPLKSPNG